MDDGKVAAPGEAWRIEEDVADDPAEDVGGGAADGSAAAEGAPAQPGAPPSPGPGETQEAEPPIVMPSRCPVCSTPGGAETPFVACAACGTLFRRERLPLGRLVNVRDARFSFASALPDGEERSRAKELACEAMKGFFALRKGKAVVLNGFGKTVLEVNCGRGLRLRAFQDYGWAVAGTETSPTAHDYARKQSLDVKQGWPDEADFGRTRFDLVLLYGNLGELPEAQDMLGHLRGVMARDGVLCALREPLVGDGPPPDDESRQACYTPDSLRRLVCEHKLSFETETVEGGVGTFWFKAKPRR